MADVSYIIELRDRVTTAAKRIGASLASVGEAAQKAASSIDGIGLAAGTVAVAGVFKLGAELEQTRVFFDTLTGSAERGAKLFNELTQFANATPFSNQLINKNAQTLLGFGVVTEDVIGQLKVLGDVSGGNADRFGALTLAFAQVQSAGKLTGQDLLQFINAGFNPLNDIAQQTGLSMGQLRKQMEKGAISAQQVKDAFARATGPGGKFHNLTIKMSTTLGGLWSTALGKATFLVSEFGLSMKDIFSPLLNGLVRAIDRLSTFRSSIFPVAQAIVIAVGIIITLVAALKIWVAVQTVLNVLLVANPIGLIIVAIGLLVGAVVTAYQQSETFRTAVDKTWASVKALGGALHQLLLPVFQRLVVSGQLMARAFSRIVVFTNNSKAALIDWASIARNVFVATIDTVLLVINGFNRTLADLFDIFKALGNVMSAIASGDIGGMIDAFARLGDSINKFFIDRIKLFLKGVEELSGAIDTLLRGDLSDAAEQAAAGIRQIVASPFNIDTDETRKQAEAAADAAIAAFKEKGASSVALASTTSALAQAQTLTPPSGAAAARARAEGVASGGVNTFNINIQQLTGVGNLNTGDLQQGANSAGNLVVNELLKAIADIRPA